MSAVVWRIFHEASSMRKAPLDEEVVCHDFTFLILQANGTLIRIPART